MTIEGYVHDKTYINPAEARILANDSAIIFESGQLFDRNYVFYGGYASRLVDKVGLYYSDDAMEFFDKLDANEGRTQVDREKLMLAGVSEDENIDQDVRNSIKHLLLAREILALTGHGIHAAELLRYQPGAKLQRHIDKTRSTSISLDGTATMYIGENFGNEVKLDLEPGHAVSLRGDVLHRVENSNDSYRHVLLLTDSLTID